MASIKQQTINSSKWNFIERVSTQGIQFFLGIIMARLLVPADFGIIGILAIFFTISQTIIDSGFNAALIRKKDVSEKDLSYRRQKSCSHSITTCNILSTTFRHKCRVCADLVRKSYCIKIIRSLR